MPFQILGGVVSQKLTSLQDLPTIATFLISATLARIAFLWEKLALTKKALFLNSLVWLISGETRLVVF